MWRWLVISWLLVGCWGSRAWIMEGQVLEIEGDTRVVVDHEEIYGLMPKMVMPFEVASPELLAEVRPGSRVVARLLKEDGRLIIDKLRVTGFAPVPASYRSTEGGPVRPGDPLPAREVPVGPDAAWPLGIGQGAPTLLTFLYTRCPRPEFCPMIVSRLQAVQAALGEEDEVRLLAVTLDPEEDTWEVLSAYGAAAGAQEGRWRFGRLPLADLETLAEQAALAIVRQGEIVHGIRWLVLDGEGALVERYDDNDWPLERVLSQLRTGEPKAPVGSDGTVSRPEPEPGEVAVEREGEAATGG